MKRRIKTLIKILLLIILTIIVFFTAINIYVCNKSNKCFNLDGKFENSYEYIIVLGCGIYDNSIPTPMLSDRLDAAITLYNQGVAPRILMSGDHRVDDYNEVAVMKTYCIERGVPEDAIITDDYGLSTFETMSHASDIFEINSAVIVTQKYHLYRAVYIAESMGIESEGVIATGHTFLQQPYYSLREYFARVKDFFLCIAH